MRNTDEILNSLNGLTRAEAPGHFYAGIRAKMAMLEPEQKHSFNLRPVLINAVLLFFLMVNIAVISYNRTDANTNAAGSAGIKAFAQEYHLTTESFGQ